MRKIKSQEEMDKKRKRNQIIIGVLLILTMISSTIGFAFFSRDNTTSNINKIKYNDIDFELGNDNLWKFKIDNQEFKTVYTPNDVESIDINFSLSINDLYNKPLYFVTNNGEAVNEINQNIVRYTLRFQEVCLVGEKCDNDLVTKDCSNNIFILKSSNTTKTYKKENCIFIEGFYEDQIKITDRIIFKALGVIN